MKVRNVWWSSQKIQDKASKVSQEAFKSFTNSFPTWWKINLADFGLGLVEPMEAKNAERSQS